MKQRCILSGLLRMLVFEKCRVRFFDEQDENWQEWERSIYYEGLTRRG